RRPFRVVASSDPRAGRVRGRSRSLMTERIVLVAVGVAVTDRTLMVRDQLERPLRRLFSPRALRRFAALSHIAGANASVELVQLLRDFVAWEQRPLLRRRAAHILDRMERTLGAGELRAGFAG